MKIDIISEAVTLQSVLSEETTAVFAGLMNTEGVVGLYSLWKVIRLNPIKIKTLRRYE